MSLETDTTTPALITADNLDIITADGKKIEILK